jgi:beta-lactamase regulating signal transducer with metallopeptidase domain
MTTLVAICGQPLVHALGWTLLHLCWQGTGVAVVLWCVLKVLDGRSSRARYAAACLALGLMVALPLATFAHLAAAEYRQRAALDDSAVVIDPGMVLRVEAGETSALLSERIAVALNHALPWVLLAWFAGVIFFAVRLNVGLLVARRMRSVATTAAPAELQHAFDALRRRLGIARAVRLMHSALVQVPTVIGWLRPVVLVPASCLTGLSAMQIEAILAHELAHIRRHDYLVSVLQSVIETVLFYHPAV